MSDVQLSDFRVAQLIDANLDRAREGLRVIEDWCRYSTNQEKLVITLKNHRQTLGHHHKHIYKQARCPSKDLGVGLQHKEQQKRKTVKAILEANFARVQEALRVLEEFSRITDPLLAKSAASMRYELYELETKLIEETLSFERHRKLILCNLCLVTNPSDNLIKIVSSVINSGVKMIQYRLKEGTDFDRIKEAKELSSICKRYGVLFIINDRIDLALAVEADGVHLGQNDMPIDIARSLLGESRIIGKSTSSRDEMSIAQKEDCDYLGVGPIYDTATKKSLTGKGTSLINLASENITLPWFAIGGINTTNVEEVRKSGCTRIAVSGAIMASENPQDSASELLKRIQ